MQAVPKFKNSAPWSPGAEFLNFVQVLDLITPILGAFGHL